MNTEEYVSVHCVNHEDTRVDDTHSMIQREKEGSGFRAFINRKMMQIKYGYDYEEEDDDEEEYYDLDDSEVRDFFNSIWSIEYQIPIKSDVFDELYYLDYVSLPVSSPTTITLVGEIHVEFYDF